MLDMSRWTMMASLFCSISLFGSAYDAVHSTVTFAGIGNPQAVQASLGDLVGRMGGGSAVPGPVGAANGTVVAMAKRPAAPSWDGVVEWVLANGTSKTMPPQNAAAIGLPTGLAVKQKGWEDDDNTRHFIQVSTQNAQTDVVLVNMNPDKSGYLYLTDRLGTLRVAAYAAANGAVTQIPVSQAQSRFDRETSFWTGMVFPPNPTVTASNATGTN